MRKASLFVGIALWNSVGLSALTITPLTLTTPAYRHITQRATLEKKKWVEACPTPGNPSGCQVIGIDEVLTEPSGGKFVPECNERGSCHWIGYADPTDAITGSTSYEITSANTEIYAFPVPIPLPPGGEPVPPPPLPEEPFPTQDVPTDASLSADFSSSPTSTAAGSACSYVTSSGTTYSTASSSVSFNDEWIESATSAWGSTLTYFYYYDVSTTSSATSSPTCNADGAPWFSPTR